MSPRTLDSDILYLQVRLRAALSASFIPANILTTSPSRTTHLYGPSAANTDHTAFDYLRSHSFCLPPCTRTQSNARLVSCLRFQKGMDRVRVCLHAGNTRAYVDALVGTCVARAADIAQDERAGPREINPVGWTRMWATSYDQNCSSTSRFWYAQSLRNETVET